MSFNVAHICKYVRSSSLVFAHYGNLKRSTWFTHRLFFFMMEEGVLLIRDLRDTPYVWLLAVIRNYRQPKPNIAAEIPTCNVRMHNRVGEMPRAICRGYSRYSSAWERTLIKVLVARISEISVCTPFGRAVPSIRLRFAETVNKHLFSEDRCSMRIEIGKKIDRAIPRAFPLLFPVFRSRMTTRPVTR